MKFEQHSFDFFQVSILLYNLRYKGRVLLGLEVALLICTYSNVLLFFDFIYECYVIENCSYSTRMGIYVPVNILIFFATSAILCEEPPNLDSSSQSFRCARLTRFLQRCRHSYTHPEHFPSSPLLEQ